MYLPGARFEVKLRIKLGDEEFEPGLKGTILEGISKMVGKAYKVKFDDGRAAQIHIVIMNNQTKIIANENAV
ncbi:MAG: hypothetical protein ACREOW_07465 [Thermodesulfobacteriota bacterium]